MRKIRIVSLVMAVAMIFSISALAISTNGISLTVMANIDNAIAHCWAECSEFTSIAASLSVYNANDSRIGYDIDYGTTTAYASLDMLGSYAVGGSSATINGAVVSGPTSVRADYE